jgi:hypothetical protein
MLPLANPMVGFDKNLPIEKSMALRQMLSLLGGLGNSPSAATGVAPSLNQPPPQPNAANMESLLGGLSMNNGPT